MRVIKIGDRYLNLERVTEYQIEDNAVIVRFGPGQETRFTRQDAGVLRRWLERIALDIADDEPATAPISGREVLGGRPERRLDPRR
jgi:hypothetical protein